MALCQSQSKDGLHSICSETAFLVFALKAQPLSTLQGARSEATPTPAHFAFDTPAPWPSFDGWEEFPFPCSGLPADSLPFPAKVRPQSLVAQEP